MKWFSLARSAHVSSGQISLAYAARFFDELAGGAVDVLLPGIQQQAGLSLAQVGLLQQVLQFTSALVNPLNGLLLDEWPRRWLMGFGAAGLGLALVLLGYASSFALLVMTWLLLGAASGPLAHSGDVVIIEAYPQSPERAFARGTLIDAAGALLGPLLVSASLELGLPWQTSLALLGLAGLAYAGLIVWIGLPAPLQPSTNQGQTLARTLWNNAQEAFHAPEARYWLAFLFCFRLLETPLLLKTLWLAQEVGLSQKAIGLYVAGEMGAGMAGLAALDVWRRQAEGRRILQIITLAVAILFPAWLLWPGVWPRVLLMVPLSFLFAMYWPLAKANSLASAPGRAGAMTAASSLFKWIPLPLLFGFLAQAMGLTPAMLLVFAPALVTLAWLLFRRTD